MIERKLLVEREKHECYECSPLEVSFFLNSDSRLSSLRKGEESWRYEEIDER